MNRSLVQRVALALAVSACGTDRPEDSGRAYGDVPDAMPAGDTGAADAQSCPAPPAAVSEVLYAPTASVCSAAIRLRRNASEAIGYQLLCGAETGVHEPEARAAAQHDTNISPSAQMLNPPSPTDAYVFYVTPADTGAVAVVSAISGLTLFGATIVWSGTGAVHFPTTWRSGDELHVGCGSSPAWPAVVSYDVVGGGEALPMPEQLQALEWAGKTTLVSAMASWGEILNVVVLRYGPSTGYPGSDASDEWVVFVTGRRAP